jgi:hypothetical protein
MNNMVFQKLLSFHLPASLSSRPMGARANPDSGSSYAEYDGTCELLKQVYSLSLSNGHHVSRFQLVR